MTDPEARAMTDQAAATPTTGPCEAIPYRHPNCGGRITSYTIEIPETDETPDTVVGEVYGPGEDSPDMERYALLFAAAPATAAERDRLKVVNEGLVKALEDAEREMKIAHNHVSPTMQPGIYHNLKRSITLARAALDEAHKP
jgi:hypothetical protein